MTPAGRPAPPRYVFLDGLRGLAALTIAGYHYAYARGQDEWLDAAPLAVDFFFCLSGFVIAHAYQARLMAGMGAARFLARRWVRLYPMYLVGAILGFSLLLAFSARGLTGLGTEAIARAALLNAAYLPYFNWERVQLWQAPVRDVIFPGNPTAWSLFFEWVAYVAYAATVPLGRRAAWACVAVSAVALVAATWIYGRTPGWGTWNFWGGFPRVGFAFFCGTLVYHYRDRLRLPPMGPASLALVAVALFAMPRPSAPWHHVYWLVAALVAVPALVAWGSRCPLTEGSRTEAWSGYLGRISYPLYCLHYPVLAALSLALPGNAPFWPAFAAYGVAAIGLSHLLLVAFDEPLRERLALRARAP